MRPVVSATTEALYQRLPALYRDADERQASGAGGYPLLRYLSLIVDQVGEVEDLVDRIDYVPVGDGGEPGDTSDLTDPATADISWLPWLGRLVGVVVDPKLSEVEARDAVTFASSGWRAGNKLAVADAAKSELTGTRYARVHDHSSSTATLGTAGAFDMLIITRPSETPSVADVLAAVERKGAKPAGAMLHHEAYAASWATLATAHPTWADWHAVGAWRDLEETV